MSLVCDRDRAAVADFWADWLPQEDINDALIDLAAKIRAQGTEDGITIERERVALEAAQVKAQADEAIRIRQAEIEKEVIAVAVVISLFIKAFGYGGWLGERLPESFKKRLVNPQNFGVKYDPMTVPR